MAKNDWEGKFGISYDALVDLILGRENGKQSWLGPHIVADEMPGFRIDIPHRTSPDVQFDVIFNWAGERKDVRLANVNVTHASKSKGLGGSILLHTIKAALQLKCDRILVKPNKMGSYYWPRHGAIVLEWPENSQFDKHFKQLTETPDKYIPHWVDKDVQWLKKIYADKNPRQLSTLAASDLTVGKIRVGQYILQNIALGLCVFDLNDDWTKQRLREKLGFDVDAFRAGSGDAGIDRSMISGTKRQAAVKTAES